MRTTITIQKTDKPVADFKPGNLVISHNDRIVLVTGDGDSVSTFEGVAIAGRTFPIENSDSWIKSSFTPFTGTITLEGK